MTKKIKLIFILLTSLFILTSCITPGSSKPAADALMLVEKDTTDLVDSLRELVTNSDLPQEQQAPILAMLELKHASTKEKITGILKYLSTIDGLDWKQYAAILYTDAVELKKVIDGLEKGDN